MQSLRQFNSGYKGLFGSGPDEEGEDDGGGGIAGESFTKRYGWMYNTREIADYECITVDQAYELPVIHALNVLAYLKAKRQHEKELIKRNQGR